MKNNTSLIYLIAAPAIIIAVFLYIMFVSELELGAVLRSIQLYIYIVIGFIVVITSLHFIIKYFTRPKTID